jgi:hypothetical protein
MSYEGEIKAVRDAVADCREFLVAESSGSLDPSTALAWRIELNGTLGEQLRAAVLMLGNEKMKQGTMKRLVSSAIISWANAIEVDPVALFDDLTLNIFDPKYDDDSQS